MTELTTKEPEFTTRQNELIKKYVKKSDIVFEKKGGLIFVQPRKPSNKKYGYIYAFTGGFEKVKIKIIVTELAYSKKIVVGYGLDISNAHGIVWVYEKVMKKIEE